MLEMSEQWGSCSQGVEPAPDEEVCCGRAADREWISPRWGSMLQPTKLEAVGGQRSALTSNTEISQWSLPWWLSVLLWSTLSSLRSLSEWSCHSNGTVTPVILLDCLNHIAIWHLQHSMGTFPSCISSTWNYFFSTEDPCRMCLIRNAAW